MIEENFEEIFNMSKKNEVLKKNLTEWADVKFFKH